MRAADPAPAPGSGGRRRSRGRPAGVGWWQPPAAPAAPAAAPTGRARRRAPGRSGRRAHGSGRTGPARRCARRARPGRGGAPGPGRGCTAPRRPARARGIRRLLPRRPRRAVVLRLLAAAVGVAALAPVVAFVLGYAFFSVPTPDDAVNNQVALISYADGTQLTRLVPEQGNRMVVPVEQVPRHVREAVLAAEDRSFYSNPGFDLTGILRAAWNQLRGGVGGGSTITQQYVKNTLVGDEATLWRKYREMVVAVKISRQHSKDEILGDYLNAIYFGRGAYGIQAAAHAYFGRPVTDLTAAEGALLAGLIQSPSRWDPAIDPDKAVQRWNFVLDGMVAQGWLPRAERDAAGVPGDGAAPAVDRGRARRCPGARRDGGARRARGPGHHRSGAEPGRPADHDDGGPGAPAGGGGGGARRARGAAGQPAQRDGGGRPGDRRHARLLRRRQRHGPGLRPRPPARRLHLQAVRRARRPARDPAGRSRRDVRRGGPAGAAQRRGRRAARAATSSRP